MGSLGPTKQETAPNISFPCFSAQWQAGLFENEKSFPRILKEKVEKQPTIPELAIYAGLKKPNALRVILNIPKVVEAINKAINATNGENIGFQTLTAVLLGGPNADTTEGQRTWINAMQVVYAHWPQAHPQLGPPKDGIHTWHVLFCVFKYAEKHASKKKAAKDGEQGGADSIQFRMGKPCAGGQEMLERKPFFKETGYDVGRMIDACRRVDEATKEDQASKDVSSYLVRWNIGPRSMAKMPLSVTEVEGVRDIRHDTLRSFSREELSEHIQDLFKLEERGQRLVQLQFPFEEDWDGESGVTEIRDDGDMYDLRGEMDVQGLSFTLSVFTEAEVKVEDEGGR